MSNSSLPTPLEISERLVRNHTQVTLGQYRGFPIVAYRNGYASGFVVGVEAQDLAGLGTRTHFPVMGFKQKPSQRSLDAAVQIAHTYLDDNTVDMPPRPCLRPYVMPELAPVAVADQELLAYLCRESKPVNWQSLSLDRLLTNPRFDAVGGSLERLEAAKAIKTWPTAHDGRMVAVTEAGRIAYGFYQTMVAPERHAGVADDYEAEQRREAHDLFAGR